MSNEIAIREEDNAFVLDSNGRDYIIPYTRCKSPEEILSWIAHLSEKTWVTTDLLNRFVKIASRKIGIDVHKYA